MEMRLDVTTDQENHQPTPDKTEPANTTNKSKIKLMMRLEKNKDSPIL